MRVLDVARVVGRVDRHRLPVLDRQRSLDGLRRPAVDRRPDIAHAGAVVLRLDRQHAIRDRGHRDRRLVVAGALGVEPMQRLARAGAVRRGDGDGCRHLAAGVDVERDRGVRADRRRGKREPGTAVAHDHLGLRPADCGQLDVVRAVLRKLRGRVAGQVRAEERRRLVDGARDPGLFAEHSSLAVTDLQAHEAAHLQAQRRRVRRFDGRTQRRAALRGEGGSCGRMRRSGAWSR